MQNNRFYCYTIDITNDEIVVYNKQAYHIGKNDIVKTKINTEEVYKIKDTLSTGEEIERYSMDGRTTTIAKKIRALFFILKSNGTFEDFQAIETKTKERKK